MRMAGSATGPRKNGLARSVCLVVRSLERSLDWYEIVFGFRPTRVVEIPAAGLRVALAEVGGVVIELCEPGRPRPTAQPRPPAFFDHQGAGQVSFAVSDAQATLKAARKRGAPLSWSVGHNAPLGLRSFLLSDPDGNLVELLEASPGEA